MLRRQSMQRGKNQAGFALIDVILGIAILSVALVSIAFAWRQSTVTTISARNYNQATYYAQQALEQLKIYDGKKIAEVSETVWTQPPFVYTKGNIPASGLIPAAGTLPAFTVTTAPLASGEAAVIDGLDSTMKARLIPVRASVTWNESGATGLVSHKIELISYFYMQ